MAINVVKCLMLIKLFVFVFVNNCSRRDGAIASCTLGSQCALPNDTLRCRQHIESIARFARFHPLHVSSHFAGPFVSHNKGDAPTVYLYNCFVLQTSISHKSVLLSDWETMRSI